MSLDGPTLRGLLLERTASWHPDLRKLFELAESNTCFPLNVRTSERIPPWKTSNITLVGDACHTMTPGLGVGANTALLDAKILADNLIETSKKDLGIIPAVSEYEKKMHAYAWDRVEKSLKWFDADAAVYKGGIKGDLAAAMMRTGMRIVNALPMLKRKMRADLTNDRGEVD